MTNLDNILKSRDITLPTQVCLVNAIVFPVRISMDVSEHWLQRKLSAKELMLFNCSVGEDSWQSPRKQWDQTSQSQRKSVLNIHRKDWCWSWSSNTLATWSEDLMHCKDSDAGRDWGQEEMGTTEDEMAGWHHRLDGRGFGWTPGHGDGQGGLVCCDSWGCEELDMAEWLNWTELNLVSK